MQTIDLHELRDQAPVRPKETLEILRLRIPMFALISFLTVVTIEQLNGYSVEQPNDLHVNRRPTLFPRQYLVLNKIIAD